MKKSVFEQAMEFVNIKTERKNDTREVSISNLNLVVLGGSHVTGTATDDSDFDVRMLVLDNERSLLSGKLYGNARFCEGEKNINHGNDMDVEVFGTMELFDHLYRGETTAFEMFSVSGENVLYGENHEVVEYIRGHLDVFYSRSILFKYLSYHKRLYHSIFPKVENLKSDVRRERVLEFGYDPKFLMKASMILDVVEDFLDNGYLSVGRPNVGDLLLMRTSKLTLDEVKIKLDEMADRQRRLVLRVEESELPARIDEDVYRNFVYEFNKKFSGV